MAKDKKKAAVAATPAFASKLAEIVAATNAPGGQGYTFTSEADRAGINPAHIQTNPQVMDANGSLATRATAEGIAFVAAQFVQTAPVAFEGSNAATKPKFVILNNVELPEVKRGGGRRASEYDFDSLQLKQGFFVPASPEMENPAKSLASTVSSASARYATDVPGEFVTRNVTVTDETTGVERKEEKKFPAKSYERKFEIRAIADGGLYGFPGVKGALIARVK